MDYRIWIKKSLLNNVLGLTIGAVAILYGAAPREVVIAISIWIAAHIAVEALREFLDKKAKT